MCAGKIPAPSTCKQISASTFHICLRPCNAKLICRKQRKIIGHACFPRPPEHLITSWSILLSIMLNYCLLSDGKFSLLNVEKYRSRIFQRTGRRKLETINKHVEIAEKKETSSSGPGRRKIQSINSICFTSIFYVFLCHLLISLFSFGYYNSVPIPYPGNMITLD